MPSSFSPSLRIELIAPGEQVGAWGTTTNTNLGTLLESAIAGLQTVSVTSSDQALTIADGAADQSRLAALRFTTTTGAPFNVYAPPVSKQYTIVNASAHAMTIFASTVAGNTTAAGTGVIIPAGASMTVRTNGTDFTQQNTHFTTASVGTLTVTSGAFTTLTSTGTTTLNGTTIPASKTLADTDSAQTLTNKTISADNNTLSGIAVSSFVLSNASGNIDGAAAQKAIPSGAVVGTTDTQTLTNKTLTSPDVTQDMQVISTNTNAVRSRTYVLTASLTLTLPSAPAVGSFVGVSNASNTTTCVIARNGSNIMSLAENMTIDVVDAGFTLYYADATRGWVIL
jgi:hypothetical protein